MWAKTLSSDVLIFACLSHFPEWPRSQLKKKSGPQESKISVGKRFPASAKLTLNDEELFLIFGGQVGGDYSSKATVEAFDGEVWNDGAYKDLPVPNSMFCVARINSTTVFASAGNDLNQKREFCEPAFELFNQLSGGSYLQSPPLLVSLVMAIIITVVTSWNKILATKFVE